MLHQFDDAAKRLDAFLKTDPDNADALALKTFLHQQRGSKSQ
jgi:hypothetical protein